MQTQQVNHHVINLVYINILLSGTATANIRAFRHTDFFSMQFPFHVLMIFAYLVVKILDVIVVKQLRLRTSLLSQPRQQCKTSEYYFRHVMTDLSQSPCLTRIYINRIQLSLQIDDVTTCSIMHLEMFVQIIIIYSSNLDKIQSQVRFHSTR